MSENNIEQILDQARSVVARGNALAFPPVIAHNVAPDELRLTLDIRPELAWFNGHFPGNPVLPGVVQLHWAVAIAQAFFVLPALPREILRLKFKHIVVPPATIELVLSGCDSTDIQFTYADAGHRYSEGRLRFAGAAR